MDPIKPQTIQSSSSPRAPFQWGSPRSGKREVSQDFQRALGLHANVMSLAQVSLGHDTVHFGQKYTRPTLEGDPPPTPKKPKAQPKQMVTAPPPPVTEPLNGNTSADPPPSLDPKTLTPPAVPTIVEPPAEGSSPDVSSTVNTGGVQPTPSPPKPEPGLEPGPEPLASNRPPDNLGRQVVDNVKYILSLGIKLAPIVSVFTPIGFLLGLALTPVFMMGDRFSNRLQKQINPSNLFPGVKNVHDFVDKYFGTLSKNPGAVNQQTIAQVFGDEAIGMMSQQIKLMPKFLQKPMSKMLNPNAKASGMWADIWFGLQGKTNPVDIVWTMGTKMVKWFFIGVVLRGLAEVIERIPRIGPPIAVAMKNPWPVIAFFDGVKMFFTNIVGGGKKEATPKTN